MSPMNHRYRTGHLQQKTDCGHQSLLSVSSSQTFTEPFSSLDLIFFARLVVERMASFVRPTFASWCIIIPSSLFSLFRTESTEFSVVHVYLWLNGVKPYTKCAWINRADHRRSKPNCGIHIAKISATSPIVINMLTRELLAGETQSPFV